MEVGGFKIGKLPLPIKWDENALGLCGVVGQMLSLNKQLPSAKTDHEKTALQRQIDATDQQIDQFVYELYEISQQERKLLKSK